MQSKASFSCRLSRLTTTADASTSTVWYYINGYFIINAGVVVIYIFMVWLVFKLGMTASRNLHNNLIEKLLRAPMWFFDITPSGRLMNRISKDISVTDDQLPSTFISYLSTLSSSLVVVATIIFVTPMFLAALIPILLMYYYSQLYFVKSQRELKRLESISRSPVFSLFAETIDGATTIRAFADGAR
jgi:ATP-binding cassette subfamily C (CFTR/MRP) protein 1